MSLKVYCSRVLGFDLGSRICDLWLSDSVESFGVDAGFGPCRM